MQFTTSAFNLSDGAILLVLLIAFIRGIKKGLTGSLKGFVFNLMVLLLAAYVAGVCSTPLLDTPTGANLYSAIYSKAAGWGDLFNKPIFFQDGAAMMYNSEGTLVSIKEFASNAIAGLIVNFLATKLLPSEGGVSLKEAIVPNLVSIIFAIILVVVFFIVFKLLFKIIAYLWKKPVDKNPKLKGIDRFFGLVFSVLTGIVFVQFVYGLLGIFENLGFMGTAMEYIKTSAFSKLVYYNNPIRTLLINMFGALGK